jgi:hypothetical protein
MAAIYLQDAGAVMRAISEARSHHFPTALLEDLEVTGTT